MARTLAAFLVAAFSCAAANPVLRFSTYLGGSDREVQPVTVAAPDGSLLVALSTASVDLPVSADAAQKAPAAGKCSGVEEGADFPRNCYNLYVARLSPAGKILRASYLGGSADQFVAGILLDRAGNVWLAGTTGAADFPRAQVIGKPEATFSGGFVVELSGDLTRVLQSTVVIGGPASAFALDGAGAAYFAGRTGSAALPATADAIQRARTPGNLYGDGFVARLAPGGSLAYATYFGGNSDTSITAVAVDASGRVTFAGYTEADDLPAGGTRYGKRSASADAFVARIAPDGRSLAWLRYIGGSGFDSLATMVTDAAGNIFVGGVTSSPDFPGDDYSGESQTAPRGFVTKVSADGATVLSSRMFGYYVDAMALDGTGAGAVWLTGKCCAGALDASPSALQVARNGYPADAFLAQLADTGPPLWASYIGGTGEDDGTSVASTPDGVVLAGITFSFDFPLDDAAEKSLHQKPGVSPVLADGFVMRFGNAEEDAPAVGQVTNAASYQAGEAAPGSIAAIFGDDLGTTIRRASAVPLPYTLGDTGVTVNGAAAPLFYVSPSQVNAQIPFETALGTAVVQVRRGDTASATQSLSIVPASPGLFVSIDGFAAITTPNFPSTTVHGGDWITLWATGLGAVDGSTPPRVKAPVGVTLGGVSLEVTWAGLSPGFAGLYQVNAQLPAGIGKGFRYEPVVITVGGKTSNVGMVTVDGR